MADLKRPAGLLRRDRHLIWIVSAIAACNVATSVLYWSVQRRDLREARRAISDRFAQLAQFTTNAVTRADAACRAAASGVVVPVSSGDDSFSAPAAVPVVLGYGQTKGVHGRRYIYRDTREPSGEVRRDYFPLPASRPSRSAVDDSPPYASERSEVEAEVPTGLVD